MPGRHAGRAIRRVKKKMHAGHGPKKSWLRKLGSKMFSIGSKEAPELENLRYHPAVEEQAHEQQAHEGHGAKHAEKQGLLGWGIQLPPLGYSDIDARLLLERVKQMNAAGNKTHISPEGIQQLLGVEKLYSKMHYTVDRINSLEKRLQRGFIPDMNVSKGFSTRHNPEPVYPGWGWEIRGAYTKKTKIDSPVRKPSVSVGLFGRIPIIGGAFTRVGYTLQTMLNVATYPFRRRKTYRKEINESLRT